MIGIRPGWIVPTDRNRRMAMIIGAVISRIGMTPAGGSIIAVRIGTRIMAGCIPVSGGRIVSISPEMGVGSIV